MGWLRNLLVFPDDVWVVAADKLGAEFVQGKWLANSAIKLLHRNHPITLEVQFGTGDDNTQYTTAVPGVALDPKIKLAMIPQAYESYSLTDEEMAEIENGRKSTAEIAEAIRQSESERLSSTTEQVKP